MPTASDPAVEAFEEQSGRALTALGTDALPVEGFESFERLCVKTANIVGAYAMAGTGGTAGEAQQQRMVANVEQHLDQMFTPLLFSAHCTAQHLPFLEGEVDPSNTARLQAVTQMRDGVSGQVIGLLQMASDPSLDAGRRRRIMDLLAQDASKFAVGLTAPQRQQIIAAAQEVEATLPEDMRPQAQRLRSELQGASCGTLCSMT